MRWKELIEDGRIVKGVNTTVDVDTDEIKTQAAKFGNKVDKDGRPKNHPKKTKGSTTNVLFNLGLAESKSHTCPRTKASSCQCESVNTISESQEAVTAVCTLEQSDTVKGTILFKQLPGQSTLIVGEITGLEPGEHGFHIHEFGDLSKGCESAGGHYNPDGVDHGDLEQGHVGDLSNITADEDGVANISLVAKRVDLTGERSVVGRAVVVHADQDDLGQGGDAESLKTGNAGDRLACGVITLKETVEEAAGVGIVTKQNTVKEGIKYQFEDLHEYIEYLNTLEEASLAQRVGAGALAVMMGLAPVAKAFGMDTNTSPLPDQQTSTMVQKDAGQQQDLDKIQMKKAPVEAKKSSLEKPGYEYYKTKITIPGKGSLTKNYDTYGIRDADQLKSDIENMFPEGAVEVEVEKVKNTETKGQKVKIDQSILKKLVKELEKRNGKQSLQYLTKMAELAGAKPGASNAHAVAAMKAYLGK